MSDPANLDIAFKVLVKEFQRLAFKYGVTKRIEDQISTVCNLVPTQETPLLPSEKGKVIDINDYT